MPRRCALRTGIVALVSTAPTSPQSCSARGGPTSMGERRSTGARGMPSTQATSSPPRPAKRARSLERCPAALRARARRPVSSGPCRGGRVPPPPHRGDDPLHQGPGGLEGGGEFTVGRDVGAGEDPGPGRPASAACRRSAPSTSPAIAFGASSPLATSRARLPSARSLPGVTSTPRLWVMTSSSSCASSKTTMSCGGSTAPPLARCAP